MDFSNTPIADHRADPEANRTENAYPPRGIFDRRAELLAQRLSLLLIVRGSALGFFHMFELCNKLIDVVTHAGTLLCRLGAYAEAAALTLVELKDLDKRSQCRGLGFESLQPLRGLQRVLLLIVTVFFDQRLRLADDFRQIGKRLRRHRIEGKHCRKEADDWNAPVTVDSLQVGN